MTELDSTTWWDFEGSPNGALRLMTRCQFVWNWSLVFCQRVLMGYKEFLELKRESNDLGGSKIIPSTVIHQMWQQHILDTHHYRQDCVLLVGQNVEYPVDAQEDTKTKNRRISDTCTRLCQKKKCQPTDLDKDVWAYAPPPKIKLPSATDGSTIIINENERNQPKAADIMTIAIQWNCEKKEVAAEFKVTQSMKLDHIFQAYAKQRGLDRSSLTFLLRSQDDGEIENDNRNCNSTHKPLVGNETPLQLFPGKMTGKNDIQVWIDCEPSRWEC
jgi:hypothetical protein